MRIVITGGAGFIGANAAYRFLRLGHSVTIIDDLSRLGSQRNLDWLARHARFGFRQIDVSDTRSIMEAFRDLVNADIVLHFAGQVGVSESVRSPRRDFEINCVGTLNVLEAMRSLRMDALLIYSSTNKVYGALEQIDVCETEHRYLWKDGRNGISEDQPLNLATPYGCSKGAADQYVLDYHRSYKLQTAVIRQSCVCGPRQMGCEEQGWVAWFMIAHLCNLPITIYGNGKQVRDILLVSDLLNLIEAMIEKRERVVGRAYNVGGGPDNTLSLLELIEFMGEHDRRAVSYVTSAPRPGDQRIYVSDITRAQSEFGWTPTSRRTETLNAVWSWIAENRSMFADNSQLRA